MDKAFFEIQARIAAACKRVGREPDTVTLIGASKTVPVARLVPFLQAGLGDLGENYVQEGVPKIQAVTEHPGVQKKVRWHYIGALQSNKVRDVVRWFDVIHSVDRVSLARAIDKAAREQGKLQTVLLQVNVGDEATKAGCSLPDLSTLAAACAELPNLAVSGLMCLPPYSEDPERTRPYFRLLREARDSLLHELGGDFVTAKALPEWQLSMGMSNDFEVAIEEGATMIRVGTKLFGTRT